MIELKIINNSEKNNKKPNTFYKFLFTKFLILISKSSFDNLSYKFLLLQYILIIDDRK